MDAAQFDEFDAVTLANVAEFSDELTGALEKYLRRGGGLIVFPGAKINADFYNQKLAKQSGVLPASFGPAHGDAAQQSASFHLQGKGYEHPIVSIHEHTAVFPEDPKEIFEYARQGRQVTGYAGLARSGVDVVFENFMDGTALITSKAGWKWDDIVLDVGMRFSDIDHQGMVYIATTYLDLEPAKAAGRIAFVPWLEAATAIENEIDRVDVLYGFGVRGMGITYSEANALGSGLREQNDVIRWFLVRFLFSYRERRSPRYPFQGAED